MKSQNLNYLIKYLFISVLAVSILSLLIVYKNQYIAELHMAKALPLAVLAGLSAIAIAIYEKK
jgi:hypothetical protein